jgi:Uma2 family endonuclease
MSIAASDAQPVQSDQHIVLQGIGWDLYVALRDLPENRNKRMVYDRGVLEIMTLSSFHERIAELIARFVDEWTVAQGIPVVSCGSMTFQREDLDRGLEPDKCYYIQHEPLIRGRRQIDLTVDPPPDLVVEVNYVSSSLDKMAIYADIGVPEVWRWRDESLQVFALAERQYQPRNDSACLPGFPFDELSDALVQRHQVDETTLSRRFREAIQPRKP